MSKLTRLLKPRSCCSAIDIVNFHGPTASPGGLGKAGGEEALEEGGARDEDGFVRGNTHTTHHERGIEQQTLLPLLREDLGHALSLDARHKHGGIILLVINGLAARAPRGSRRGRPLALLARGHSAAARWGSFAGQGQGQDFQADQLNAPVL